VSYETVTHIIEEISDHARALKGADLADKAELYKKLGLNGMARAAFTRP
jgi:hypothetical protein